MNEHRAMTDDALILWLEEVRREDTGRVGGKNASLGEMIHNLRSAGIRVPGGFATTASAYRAFLRHNELEDRIQEQVQKLRSGGQSLDKTGRTIRRMIGRGSLPGDLRAAVASAYRELSARNEAEELAVAVRSSATAEDLPEASFAGQQETYLNVTGEDAVLDAIRRCYASLFTDRAIAYRHEQGFDDLDLALSAGIQAMVRSDKAGAGVMFSIDTDSGFPRTIVIEAAWGLGESVVQGSVEPDEYRVFKPLLDRQDLIPIVDKTLGEKHQRMVYAKGDKGTTKTVNTPKNLRRRFVLDDQEILTLARWAKIIEAHYGCPMDIEWAKDGLSGELYCVQARPETVHASQDLSSLASFRLLESSEVLLEGLAVGDAIASGRTCVIRSADQIDEFEPGSILVTEMTDPDWVPVMKQAAAIVTDHGGRTSHAAIVSRELGVPAVIGTIHGTEVLKPGQMITVSCAEGEKGQVYEGELEFERRDIDLSKLPEPPVQIMMNLASPTAALRWWRLPAQGVGLARMEFIINGIVKVHPLALTRFDQLEDRKVRRRIEELTRGYDDLTEYFVDHLSRGIAAIAASQHPHDVVVRMSDFKTNEYARLLGGEPFEPHEENPMLGFRGASRYYSEDYRDGFALECRAIVRARNVIGLDNIIVMIPFVRTPEEADRVLAVMAEEGLVRGQDGLKVYMMCEIPSNVFLADEFTQRFDGFSIGSNDLTQLILGVDRDSARLEALFDERNDAVKQAIAHVIERCRHYRVKVGICGQAPSDHPDFARFLVEQGIDSISLNPDSVVDVIESLADVRPPATAR